MVTVKKIVFNPFQENTYVIYDETNSCIIVDPGCYEKHEEQELIDFIESKNLKPTTIASTHSHIDHVFGNNAIKEYFNIPLTICKQDEETLARVPSYAPMYGFSNFNPSKPDNFFNLEQGLSFGNTTLEIRFVPGHAPGHVVFISHAEQFVINGDCLFNGSIGRTDLPGGDFDTLINSIKEQLFTLPDEYTVYCGHGPETTIGNEKKHNPFLT